MFGGRTRPGAAQVRAQINSFMTALGLYKLTPAFSRHRAGLQALRVKPEGVASMDRVGPVSAAGHPDGPWGHPYLYKFRRPRR